MHQLEHYGIIPADEKDLYARKSSALADPAKRREMKISQYKKTKEIKDRIQVRLYPSSFVVVLTLHSLPRSYKNDEINPPPQTPKLTLTTSLPSSLPPPPFSRHLKKSLTRPQMRSSARQVPSSSGCSMPKHMPSLNQWNKNSNSFKIHLQFLLVFLCHNRREEMIG